MSDSGSRGDRRNNTDKGESWHAATDPEKCEEMQEKYDWKLLRVEPSNNSTLKVKCIFEGETEFPNYLED
jgi:hypothetical protein